MQQTDLHTLWLSIWKNTFSIYWNLVVHRKAGTWSGKKCLSSVKMRQVNTTFWLLTLKFSQDGLVELGTVLPHCHNDKVLSAYTLLKVDIQHCWWLFWGAAPLAL